MSRFTVIHDFRAKFSIYTILGLHGTFRNLTQRISDNPLYLHLVSWHMKVHGYLTPAWWVVCRCTSTADGSGDRWYTGVPVSNF